MEKIKLDKLNQVDKLADSLALQQGWGDLRVLRSPRELVGLLCSPLPAFFNQFPLRRIELLSSPEVRAGCRPSAPAVLTCSGRAALVSPTQPGVRC